jgi:AraC family transcriptional regulator
MQVSIVTFPETKVAAISHCGHPSQEHDTARKLIAWKIEHRLLDQSRHRSYGLHHADPRSADPSRHHVDFCISVDKLIPANSLGILERVIPRMRCALARDIGSRADNLAAKYLYDVWLPLSGEEMADYPLIFHYVNVGPGVVPGDAITDVYLPLKG